MASYYTENSNGGERKETWSNIKREEPAEAKRNIIMSEHDCEACLLFLVISGC